MNLPSVKTLRRVFGDDAPDARRQLERWRDGSRPPAVDTLFARLDSMANTHGVECIWTDGRQDDSRYGPRYLYLNTGDTYADTLLVDRDTGRVWVGSWGDLVEMAERNPGRWGRIE
ncbi:MAG: hypothetical protein IPH08_04130 [Rhodocyclaceae bacterium]|nr:hypothetical protein [Rhodocyclaceae bacterium]